MGTSLTKTALDVHEKEKSKTIGTIDATVELGGNVPYAGPLIDMGSFLF